MFIPVASSPGGSLFRERSQRSRLPLLALAALLAAAAPAVRASIFLDVQLTREGNSASGGTDHYVAFGTVFQFDEVDPLAVHPVRVSSSNGAFRYDWDGTTGTSQSASFQDFGAFKSALGTSWYLVVDRGLQSEKTYTFSVGVGGLTADLLPLTKITSPTHGQSLTEPAAGPYAWSGQTAGFDTLAVVLRRDPDGDAAIAASDSLPTTVTTWTPEQALEPGAYEFLAEYVGPAGAAFTVGDPTLEGAGTPLNEGWIPNIHFISNDAVRFTVAPGTVVPEPALTSGVVALILVAGLTLRACRRAPVRRQD